MLVTINEDLNNIYITSDHHFGHQNIIKYCGRPFETSEEMDKVLIENWNEIVRPQDWVIHLGDFTLENVGAAREYFRQLNGDICILCNVWHHDKRWLEYAQERPTLKSKSGFDVRLWPPMAVLEVPQLGADGHPLAITLCHYPLAVWDRKHYGAWHLHGHSHGKYTYADADDCGINALDIGVDCQNFYPINLSGILEIMMGRGFM